MRVLITGAGGFVGSHLVEHLVEQGDDVRAAVHYRGDGTRGHLEDSPVLDAVEVIAGDIRDGHWVVRAAEGIDIIYNLAAQAGIPRSYTSPEQFMATNSTGTLHILEAARTHGCRVLHMSTSEVYGTGQYVPMDESHPTQAQSPYATSKLAADSLCHSYRLSFGLDARVVRSFNIYGPRQSQRAVIPNVMAQVLLAVRRPVLVEVGALDATRDFTFVTDNVRALRMLAMVDEYPDGPINVGSGRDISIKDVVRRCGEAVGIDALAVLKADYVRPEASEVQRLCCDNAKVKALVGWTPQVELEAGFAHVAAWLEPRLDMIRKGMVE